MNTIPLTFNERQLHRTVLSGNESVPVVKLPLGVLLLNTGSGGLYRVKLLENLIKNGFSSIVSVEKSSENYNVEDFARMFPCVKFIVPMENACGVWPRFKRERSGIWRIKSPSTSMMVSAEGRATSMAS